MRPCRRLWHRGGRGARCGRRRRAAVLKNKLAAGGARSGRAPGAFRIAARGALWHRIPHMTAAPLSSPAQEGEHLRVGDEYYVDRKSTRLNSSHTVISYAVFCLKKK